MALYCQLVSAASGVRCYVSHNAALALCVGCTAVGSSSFTRDQAPLKVLACPLVVNKQRTQLRALIAPRGYFFVHAFMFSLLMRCHFLRCLLQRSYLSRQQTQLDIVCQPNEKILVMAPNNQTSIASGVNIQLQFGIMPVSFRHQRQKFKLRFESVATEAHSVCPRQTERRDVHVAQALGGAAGAGGPATSTRRQQWRMVRRWNEGTNGGWRSSLLNSLPPDALLFLDASLNPGYAKLFFFLILRIISGLINNFSSGCQWSLYRDILFNYRYSLTVP
jgi:hypothetical protein